MTSVVRRLLLNFITRPRIPFSGTSYPVYSDGNQPGVLQRVGSAAGMVVSLPCAFDFPSYLCFILLDCSNDPLLLKLDIKLNLLFTRSQFLTVILLMFHCLLLCVYYRFLIKIIIEFICFKEIAYSMVPACDKGTGRNSCSRRLKHRECAMIWKVRDC